MNHIQKIQEIEQAVADNFQDESNIEASELRTVLALFTDFLKKTSPLATGTFAIGDVIGNDMIRTVNLPYNVGTSNYRVEGSLVSKSANFDADNDVFEVVKDRTASSFKICLRQISSNTQNLDFEYAIYPKV